MNAPVRFSCRTQTHPEQPAPGLVAASFVILSNVVIFLLFAAVAVHTLSGWLNF